MKKYFVFTLFISAQLLTAQIADKVILDSVVISNNRISYRVADLPKSIEVISSASLKSAPAQSFAEALQYVSGLDIRRRGPLGVQSDISIRGGSFDQVLILINGVRMNDAQTGHHTLYLPVEMLDIERVEIIRGPAARTYGQNAFSGAVNIITKTKDKSGINATLSYGSFGTLQAGLGGSFITPNGKLSQTIAANYSQSDGYDYNRAFDMKSIFYQGNYSINDKTKVEWFSGGSSRDFGANGFYALPTHKEQYEEVSTSISSVAMKNIFDKWTLTSRLSHRWNDDYYVFDRKRPEIFTNKTTSNRYTADINASIYNSLGILGVGAEVSFESLNSLRLGNHNRNIASLFAEQKMVLVNEKLNITPGIFLNKFSDRKVQILPGLDLSYQFTKRFKIYGGVNYANRIPTYTDLYYRSSVEKGNAELLSESVRSIEIGGSISEGNTYLKVSAYRNMTNNLIDWTKKTNKDTFWIARNYVATNFNGLEVSSALDFANFLNFKNTFTVDFSASFINAEAANSDNQYITRYQFNHIGSQFIMGLKKGYLDNRLLLQVHYRLIDRVGEDIDPITKNNLLDVNLFDAAISYYHKNFTLKYTVNNLTDQSYKEINNVLMPGRWHQVLLGVRF